MSLTTNNGNRTAYLNRLEDEERRSRGTEVYAIGNAKKIAELIKSAAYPTLSHNSQGSRRYTIKLEENERQRRLVDKDESRARKSNAGEIAQSIRVDAATIKARFIKRPSAWKSTLYNLKALGNQGRSALVHATHFIPPQVSSAAFNALGRLPSFSSLLDTAHSLVHLSTSGLEEAERQRRIQEDPTNCARANANRVARLIANTSAKNHFATRSNGIYKVTRRIEENERLRRLVNKSESEFHKMKSAGIANLINQLGWPFIRTEGACLRASVELVTEEERTRRLMDPNTMFVSRYNASRIAACVSSAMQHLQSRRILMQQVRKLEEKERSYRMKNGEHSVINARREAQLIADIGGMFYKPRTSTEDYPFEEVAKKMENEDWSIGKSVSKQQTKRKYEQKVARLISLDGLTDQVISNLKTKQIVLEHPHPADSTHFDISVSEEKERKARISDKLLQQQARSNAATVSRIIRVQQRSTTFAPLPTINENGPHLSLPRSQRPLRSPQLASAVDSPSLAPLSRRSAAPKAKINVAARVPTPVAPRHRSGMAAH